MIAGTLYSKDRKFLRARAATSEGFGQVSGPWSSVFASPWLMLAAAKSLVDALVRLMLLKQSVDDPDALRRIYEILIPREFTKLDEIFELVFSTAEDAKQVEDVPEAEEEHQHTESAKPTEAKFTPVAFNALIAERVSQISRYTVTKAHARFILIARRERSCRVCGLKGVHGKIATELLVCLSPHQKEALEGAQRGFAAFGCGSPANTFLIPMVTFAGWLDGMNMTLKETGRIGTFKFIKRMASRR